MPMTGRFEFEGVEAAALLEESRAAEARLFTEAQRYVAAGIDLKSDPDRWDGEPGGPETGAPPGLWLRNDRGVYLQSNARGRKESSVAYARGYRAGVAVGDEPICEFIDAGSLAQLRPDDTLVVTLAEEKILLSVLRPG
jgi:hypothetical protein